MAKDTISIGGRDLRVKKTLRSYFIYEKATGRPFKIETMTDNYLFLYSILLASNPDQNITFSEFIDAVDERPEILEEMNAILTNRNEVEELIAGGEGSAEGGKDEKKN